MPFLPEGRTATKCRDGLTGAFAGWPLRAGASGVANLEEFTERRWLTLNPGPVHYPSVALTTKYS
jgi:hypothetical protein